MILYHATVATNVASILKWGILAQRSKGAMKTIWVSTAAKAHRAMAHAQSRQRTSFKEVVLIEIEFRKRNLRAGGKIGLYHTGGRDVPAADIRRVFKMWEGFA